MDLHQELLPASYFPFSGTLLTQSWMHSQLSRQISEQLFVSRVRKACCKHCGAETSSLGSSEHQACCSHAQLLLEHK